eukprot:5797138-Prymnesium_polylepis.1
MIAESAPRAVATSFRVPQWARDGGSVRATRMKQQGGRRLASRKKSDPGHNLQRLKQSEPPGGEANNNTINCSCLTHISRRWLEVPSSLNRPRCMDVPLLENWPDFDNWRHPDLLYDPKGCQRQPHLETWQPPTWNRCEQLFGLSQGWASTVTWVVLDMWSYGQPWGHSPVPLTACAPANVVVGCMSCTPTHLRAGIDISLPAPTPIRKDDLYPTSASEVRTRCMAASQRPAHARLAAFFVGGTRTKSTRVRTSLRRLHGLRVNEELGDIYVAFTD